MNPLRTQRFLLMSATALTYLLIVAGGTVCVTGSTLGCPDWPGCYGRAVPPLRADAIVEYAHRAVAALATLSIVVAAAAGRRSHRSDRWVSRPPLVALPLLGAVIVFGALAVLRGIGPGLAAVDLGSALLVQALLVVATVAVFRRDDLGPSRFSLRGPLARLAMAAAVAALAVLVSGVVVNAVVDTPTGFPVRCLGWPVYDGSWASAFPDSRWLPVARLVGGIAAGLLVVGATVQAWRTRRSHRALVAVATGAGAVLLAELAVGAAIAAGVFTVPVPIFYVVLAAALWGLLAALVALAAL